MTGRHVEHKEDRYSPKERYREDIKDPLDNKRGNAFGIGSVVFMLQDKYPDKIAQPCRDYQVNRLAHENTGCGDRNADMVIEIFKDYLVAPSAQPPCRKANHRAHGKVYRNDIIERNEQIIPDPEEHIGNNTNGNKGRNDDCANFSIHESATITSGSMNPSQKHLLFSR